MHSSKMNQAAEKAISFSLSLSFSPAAQCIFVAFILPVKQSQSFPGLYEL